MHLTLSWWVVIPGLWTLFMFSMLLHEWKWNSSTDAKLICVFWFVPFVLMLITRGLP